MDPQSRNQLVQHLIKNLETIEEEHTTPATKQEQRKEQSIVIKKVNKRTFKNYAQIHNLTPYHHVYKLFNTFGINQTAIQEPDFEQSFVRTYFYHKVVTRVEKYKNAVLITTAPLSETVCQPPVNYFVQRLNSQGTKQANSLANQVQELTKLIIQVKNKTLGNIIQEDKSTMTKFFNENEDKMFICKFGLHKIAFSNSLIQYMGYDVDQFATEVVKYRTFLYDFLSSNSYFKIAAHALGTVKHLMKVDLNQISLQEYLDLSRMTFRDYVYSKNYKKSYCDLEYLVPARGSLCIRVNKIIYQTSELDWKLPVDSKQQFEQQKASIKQKQMQLLHHLGSVPGNWVKKRTSKIAGYTDIPNLSNKQ